VSENRQRGTHSYLLAAALIAVPWTLFVASDSGRAYSRYAPRRAPASRFVCGYDPQGAVDEISNHKANSVGLGKRRENPSESKTSAGISFEDAGNISLAQDDGTTVISPTRFDLKNSSILFTPDGEGYRLSIADVGFSRDFGSRLGYFLGVDNQLGDGDNGYRDVTLLDAPFPFFGVSYDTIYVGTNGYITFRQGDTSARISPASLAGNLPRIAPFWADLEVVDSGDIYYNRFDGHHLITWEAAGQPTGGGLSTFQAALYDDGRIVFVYRKVKAQAGMAGISPGGTSAEPHPVDFSNPPAETLRGPFFEVFGKQKRIDLPALLQAFYRTHPDSFDTAYVWTDFDYDNGLGIAHSFNVRNQISGIGLKHFDRGLTYGSPERLSTIITMGNAADWPSDPQADAAGLNSAISIVCHEQGHRWLAYVGFDPQHDTKNDLLGRENAHWSFLVDTRTNAQGTFSSLMEGNAWRDAGGGTFTTVESAVNYFTSLDLYLMGLGSADDVGEIPYLVSDSQLTEFLREKSPFSGFSMSAVRNTATVAQIVKREGPRIPDVSDSQKEFRVAFILLTEQGSTPSPATLERISRYRDALVEYFSVATGGRGSMNASLTE